MAEGEFSRTSLAWMRSRVAESAGAQGRLNLPRRARYERRSTRSILEPAAVLDIVGFMFYDFGGLLSSTSDLSSTTAWATKLFGSNINMRMTSATHSSPVHIRGEGIRRQRVQLVRTEW